MRPVVGATTKLLLIVAGFAVGLAIAEAGLSIADLPKSAPFFQEFYGPGFKLMTYDSDPSDSMDLDLRDEEVRARFAARLSGTPDFSERWHFTPHAVEVRFNSYGFREREFTDKAPGSIRIAIVGDSFTYGHGLTNASSIPRQLEGRVRDLNPSQSIEVLNLGVGAIGLALVTKVASRALDEFDPNILVYAYFLNDPIASTPGPGIHDMLDPGWLDIKGNRSHLRIGQEDTRGFRVMRVIRRFIVAKQVTRETVDWYRRLHAPENWAPTARAIRSIAERASERDVRFMLVLLPLAYHMDGEYPFAQAHSAIVNAPELSGVEIVDMLPVLRGFPDEELTIHPRDRHPNKKYAALVAEALSNAIGGFHSNRQE